MLGICADFGHKWGINTKSQLMTFKCAHSPLLSSMSQMRIRMQMFNVQSKTDRKSVNNSYSRIRYFLYQVPYLEVHMLARSALKVDLTTAKAQKEILRLL